MPAWKRSSGSSEPRRRARCAHARPSRRRPARVSAQPSASALRIPGAAAQARRAERDRPARRAVARLEDRELGVRVDAGARQQSPLRAHQGEGAPRGGRPPGGELELPERDHVLGQRQAGDDAPHRGDRGAQVAARRGEPRTPGARGQEARDAGERLGVVARGPRRAPAGGLEVAVQHLDGGDVLRRAGAGRDGEPHRVRGAREVAVQLAQVGDPRVGGQPGPPVGEALQRALGGAVPAELDERVDEQRVGLERAGGEGPRAAGQAQRPAEVMARRGQRAELDDRAGVVRVARQRAAQQRLGAGLVGEVAGLARLLQVRGGERRLAPGPPRTDGGPELGQRRGPQPW